MIQVSLTEQQKRHLSDRVVKQWLFSQNEQQKWEASMSQDEFDDFLKETNCIVYKQQIKNYQHGTICGAFEVHS